MTETLGLVIYIIGVLSFGVLGEILLNMFDKHIEHTAEEVTEKPSTDMMTWYTKPPEEPQVGDVYIDQNNMPGIFNGKRWETMYPDPGYIEAGKIHPANCENCGAPLNGRVCEYCGTKYC